MKHTSTTISAIVSILVMLSMASAQKVDCETSYEEVLELFQDGKYSQAAALWEIAADRKEIYAHIELAKVAEHKKKNYAQAISITECALEVAFGSNIKDYRIISELQHRLHRDCRALQSSSVTVPESNSPLERCTPQDSEADQ